MTDPRVTSLEGELPDGLVDAVEAYEAALAADDVPALADAFVRAPTTLRGDASGLLVGHEAITGFRGRRGGTPRAPWPSCTCGRSMRTRRWSSP
ncbi:DUF3225 domain-containing protein [Rathayibacter oskolensis]|uniref:AtzH-like domain-containing protein n=1 Tax=Rathayibacter oskolensis TaxID=1891671 RepID=UPI00265DDA37|nr:AtzH-like domain-containing protein [Rathayibacter oskolensis]WKK71533.1 DUF3225 domain-containing protein [Rathayibacter oskolensis]